MNWFSTCSWRAYTTQRRHKVLSDMTRWPSSFLWFSKGWMGGGVTHWETRCSSKANDQLYQNRIHNRSQNITETMSCRHFAKCSNGTTLSSQVQSASSKGVMSHTYAWHFETSQWAACMYQWSITSSLQMSVYWAKFLAMWWCQVVIDQEMEPEALAIKPQAICTISFSGYHDNSYDTITSYRIWCEWE